MDLGLRGHVALVLGSSSGIGHACALELAREGARVMLCARDEERLRRAAASLHEAGIEPAYVKTQVADVTQADAIAALPKRAYAAFGKVDILVTNAGGPKAGRFEELTPEDFEASVQLNLMSAIRATRAFIPRMVEQGWGRIVHLTSVSIRQPIDDLTVSNTVRSAFLGFTRSLATEYARHNVLVHNVCPGYTRTERLRHLEEHLSQTRGCTAAEVRAEWETMIPAGRLAAPEEIAGLVAFLCSERASYLTGTTICVDGGLARGIP
ncbi:MAG: SDR family oxidoreductase [Candidatus Latescibacterota bacterium]|nr:MAG: SDR family oxidoreductase [Candidatus Latescibacterota bacterium]